MCSGSHAKISAHPLLFLPPEGKQRREFPTLSVRHVEGARGGYRGGRGEGRGGDEGRGVSEGKGAGERKVEGGETKIRG